MSTPQAAEATQGPESPKRTSSQESIGSTPSQRKFIKDPNAPFQFSCITITNEAPYESRTCLLQEKHQEGSLSLLILEELAVF